MPNSPDAALLLFNRATIADPTRLLVLSGGHVSGAALALHDTRTRPGSVQAGEHRGALQRTGCTR